MYVWDVEAGELVAHFKSDAFVHAAVAQADDLFFANCNNGKVHILKLIRASISRLPMSADRCPGGPQCGCRNNCLRDKAVPAAGAGDQYRGTTQGTHLPARRAAVPALAEAGASRHRHQAVGVGDPQVERRLVILARTRARAGADGEGLGVDDRARPRKAKRASCRSGHERTARPTIRVASSGPCTTSPAVALDGGGIVAVVVDAVAVEGQRRVAEQQGADRRRSARLKAASAGAASPARPEAPASPAASSR